MEAKIDVGTTLIGTGILAIGVAGVYYIYSGRKLIEEYVGGVKDLEREYKQFIADGELSEDESQILEVKEHALTVLGRKIEEKGFLEQLRDILYGFGYAVGITGGLWLAHKIIDYLRKRYPPRGRTPTDYECPVCHQHFSTEDQLRHHVEQEHDIKNPDADETRHAWDIVRSWPSWVLGLISIMAGLPGLLPQYQQYVWDQLPYWAKVAIIYACLVAIGILIAFGFAPALPGYAEAAAGFAAACA